MSKREMPMDSDLVRVDLADVPESVLLKLKEHIRQMEAANAFREWMVECDAQLVVAFREETAEGEVKLEVKQGGESLPMGAFLDKRDAKLKAALRGVLWDWLGTKGVKEGDVCLWRIREKNWFNDEALKDAWLKRWAKVVGFHVKRMRDGECLLSLRMEREDGTKLDDEFVGDVQVLMLKA